MTAMALAAGPRLLIADEPTTALDVTIQAQIIDQLKRIQAELGMGVLFISHDLAVLASIAHDIAIMYAGQIVEQAPTGSILRSPMHPYTRDILRSIHGVTDQGRYWTIPGRIPNPTELPAGCPYHPRCSEARDLCRHANPEAAEFEKGRKVRCWLHL